MKKVINIFTLLIFVLLLTACGKQNKDENTIKVGVVASPMIDMVELAIPILKEQGINLELVHFTDYIQINHALNEGAIDANFSQHEPYMEAFNTANNANLVILQPVYVAPLVAYSKHLNSLEEVTNGMKLTIPKDLVNLGRSLALLESMDLISLKEGISINADIDDITENPYNLVIDLVDLNYLNRTFDDANIVIMYPSFASQINVSVLEYGIFTEDTTNSPFAISVVTRSDYIGINKINKLKEAMASIKVREYIEENFGDLYVVAF